MNYEKDNFNIPVIIMAGGKGTRLKPYTNIIPKGLLPIGDIPIIERIINNFNNYGFDRFLLSINYKKDILKAYFNRNQGYKVEFLEEKSPLGTAGSLSLIKGRRFENFFVTNCDILILDNYLKMIKFHLERKNHITVICAKKEYAIPYGVFRENESGNIISLEEKPTLDILVNTGMYIINKRVLDIIEEGNETQMTDVILKALECGMRVELYKVFGNQWLDMGEFKAMEDMIEELKE
ncbi:MAG: sugar phosphate nucleotidyltransferase [Clostridium sp.]